MKWKLILMLMLIPALACGQDDGFGDPYDEPQPDPDLIEQTVEAIGMAQGHVDAWHNISSDYETEVSQLEAWAGDIQTLADGDPNEADIIAQLQAGDAELLKAALQVDLGSIDNGRASDDVDEANRQFDGSAYQAAHDAANASLGHIWDRQAHEANADGYLMDAYDAYLDAASLLNQQE